MNVLGIDFTFFAVSDMQKSLTFYRDLLGIPLACLVHEGTWAEFEIKQKRRLPSILRRCAGVTKQRTDLIFGDNSVQNIDFAVQEYTNHRLTS